MSISFQGQPNIPVETRFWAKVRKTRGCWHWLASKSHNGYGQFHAPGMTRAHRFVYELLVGPIPSGLSVLHICDNPSCVNPKHLFLGTIRDNQADKVAKDRQAKGEAIGVSKLTEKEVLEIRKRYRRKAYHKSNTNQLATEFGVTPVMICYIINRTSWKHI